MIAVKVRFYGFVRSALREPSAELSVPDGSTVTDLLQALGERYGQKFTEKVLTRQGRLQDYVRVLLGNDLLEDGKLDVALRETAGGTASVVVYLLPAEIGG